ncbi:MAG TPA: glycerate kinase [Pseudolysinimonas sp.]|nr:glycerate kinase [Pseudolysinimonas sp.]
MPLRVVLAPDSFKGSLDAPDVAAAIAEGWRSVRPGDDIRMLPQADGGEGTLAVIASAVEGAVLRSAGTVTGPDGRAVPGHWLQLPGGTAVIELAQASGLPLMASPDPLGATTCGLGEVIAAALDAGAKALVIALGGSASTDGGAGALAALGMRLLDGDARPIGFGGAELARIARIDRSSLRPAPAGGVRLLSDVTAPLLGPTGAAAVFGPQKGASAADVRTLEDGLARYAALLGGDSTTPGSGAAGGTGYGFLAAWGAGIESGARAIAELTGLTAEAASADVVVSGEGRFDATSSTGKVVGQALALAGDRTVIIAGQLAADPPEGVQAWALAGLAGSVDAAIADPSRWLREAGAAAARARA